MTILKQLEEMKEKLENLERERSKVQGRREGLLEQLKAMGINSYEEGLTRLAEVTAAKEKAEAQALALLKDFEQTYAQFI